MPQSLQIPTYAGYVWSCYGLTLLALIWLVWFARSSFKAELKSAQRRLQSAVQHIASEASSSSEEPSP